MTKKQQNLIYTRFWKTFELGFINDELVTNKMFKKAFINGIFCLGSHILYLVENLNNIKDSEIPKGEDFPLHNKNFIMTPDGQTNPISYLENIAAEYTNINNTALNKAIDIIVSSCLLNNKEKAFVLSLKNLIKGNTNTINAKKPLKIFYVYRLTLKNGHTITEDIGDNRYYYGYRSTVVSPLKDTTYLSSSKKIKELVKKYGSDCFSKKFLGIYVFKAHAISHEILLHQKCTVHKNNKFFNKASQNTTKFEYDNTGRVQTESSNLKRSIAQKNKSKHTVESKQKLRDFQLNRAYSEEEKQKRTEHAQKINQTYVVCPHCNKKVQKAAGARWHFDNCKKNPNVSEKTLLEREQLKQKAIERNTKHKPIDLD